MKISITLILIALIFGARCQALASPRIVPAPAVILQDLDHLDQGVKEFTKDRTDFQQARDILENSLLPGDDRTMMKGRLSMDQESLTYLRLGLDDDLQYLRDHWKVLTKAQKALVKKAEAQLD